MLSFITAPLFLLSRLQICARNASLVRRNYIEGGEGNIEGWSENATTENPPGQKISHTENPQKNPQL